MTLSSLPPAVWDNRTGTAEPPLFSLCIPQYSRFPFLLEAVRTFAAQSFRSFEVCVSDGGSPERQHEEVVRALEAAGLPFVYQVHAENLRYDANLRAAIALARGRYCVLMGNDDGLAGPDTLALIAERMEALGPAGVVLGNYADAATGEPALRIPRTANYGAAPLVAATHFRNFSFVSGVVLDRARAQALATDRWDGSEMYQTYVGCRIIAEGGPLLELTDVLVRKDLPVPDAEVDSYARRPRDRRFKEHRLPLGQLGRVVFDAIGPSLPAKDRQRAIRVIFLQLLLATYPYWLVEYRRVQSWRYAMGVALGMRPGVVLEGVPASVATRGTLALAYAGATLAGLSVPARVFRSLQQRLYRLVKRPLRAAA